MKGKGGSVGGRPVGGRSGEVDIFRGEEVLRGERSSVLRVRHFGGNVVVGF